ncbi:MAG TPA: TonB-dependent receptor, partial [Terriglobales bacterium]
GTLWGANAVNGVINIVTKSADQTPGAMVSISVSPEEGYSSTIQYGGHLGRNANYRLFGRASYWEPLQSVAGGSLPDHFGVPQAGTRVDWTISAKDALSVEAGTFDGRLVSTLLGTRPASSYLVKGNHVLVRWNHTASERSHTDTLAYCDWYARFGAPTELRNTCDLEFQNNYEFNKRHALIWGGSFFTTGDDLAPDLAPYSPERRRSHVVSGFAQYELVVLRNRLRLLAGSKFDKNSYTGEEYQPQVRAVWTPGKSHAVWASVSRAIRVPTRNNSDLRLIRPAGVSNGKPVFVAITGNPDLEEERLKAYELGYRYERRPLVSLDLALYYNDYSELIATAPPVPEVLPDRIVLHTPYINGPQAQTHGAELSAKWRPLSRWAITTAVTELRGSAIAVQATPRHIFHILSRLDLPRGLEFDSGVYRCGGVPLGRTQNSAALPLQNVAPFTRLDLGIGWHVRPNWRLAVWGRNLQSARHRETRDTIFADQAGNVPRSIVFSLLWHFNREQKAAQ